MRFTVPALLILAMTACAPSTPDDRETDEPVAGGERALPGPSEGGGGGELAEIELCDAKDYRVLVGTDVKLTSFPEGANLRVFGENDIVTQDYIPQRTNIVHDTSDQIIRIYCG